MHMKVTLTALTLAMMAIGPLSTSIIPAAGLDAAFAERGGNGNGGGGGNGNSGGNGGGGGNGNGNGGNGDGGNGRGAVASELKGLNAAHASPNALLHANPNSQVGRIATYKTAALATVEAQSALEDLTPPARTIAEIEADMLLLDPTLDAEALAVLQLELNDANAYEEALAEVEGIIAGAEQAEADALLAASGGRELSDAAIAELRAMLDL